MRRIFGLALAMCCAGCAGSDAHLRVLENGNALQIEPSQSKDYDYVVRIKNVIDVGYDPDNPETRKDTALKAMQAQCPAASIVGEQVVDKGTYALGRPAREYFIQIQCAPKTPTASAPSRKRAGL